MTNTISRGRRSSGLLKSGRGDEGKDVIRVADALPEKPDRRRVRGRRLPGQLEVAVGRHRPLGEPDQARVRATLLDAHLVMVAPDLAEREAGLQADRDRHGIGRRARPRVEHRRLDPLAVRHGIGGGAPALPARRKVDGLQDRLRIVARRDDERHAQREAVGRLPHRLLVLDLHQNGLARADIGDRVGEQVRPLLLEERRLSPGGLRLRIDRARLLALLDVADHDAVADHDPEAVDRAALGQRVDVDRLDPAFGWIAEDLRDAGSRGRPADRDVDVGPDPRDLDEGAGLGASEKKRTGAHLARPDQGLATRGERARRERQDRRNRKKDRERQVRAGGGSWRLHRKGKARGPVFSARFGDGMHGRLLSARSSCGR